MRFTLLFVPFLVAACGGGPDSPTDPAVDDVTVATVTVSPSTPSVTVGATQSFTATARNAEGSTLSSTTFAWSSSSASTATITSSGGVATGVAVGTTTITATAGGKSGTASLTVNAATVSWLARKDMPTARQGATAGVVNGIIYVIGGEDLQTNPLNPHLATVEAYDPATNTWTTKAPMPGARSSLSSAVVNNVIYVFGGDNGIAPTPNANTFVPVVTVQAYDPATNTWTTKAPMTIARERFAIAESGGIIYVLGGLIPSGSFVDVTATMHAYTVSTNTWSTKASMPTARNDLTAVALNGVIYAMSGQSSSKVEAYDIASNTWSTKASLTQISSQPIGSFTSGGLVYAMDGFPFIESYSPAANAWTAKTGVKTGYTGRSWATLSIVGTTMYAIGGADFFGSMKTVEARIIP